MVLCRPPRVIIICSVIIVYHSITLCSTLYKYSSNFITNTNTQEEQMDSSLIQNLLLDLIPKQQRLQESTDVGRIVVVVNNNSNINEAKTQKEHHDKRKTNVAFLIVGAVRTLKETQNSIKINVVKALCPPPNCISHLVLHLSYADNRPDTLSNDPFGKALSLNNITNNENNRQQYFHINDEDWSSDCIQYHIVDPYEIGSTKEQEAMDQYEKEFERSYSSIVSSRLRLFRIGDPRRYSMWFARAWAWRHVQRTLIRQQSLDFDFFMFLRPDMVWFQPVPTIDFFQKQKQKSKHNKREVYVHDTYFAYIPDTFAFLPTYDVADSYLSLYALVQPGVLCLGGPNFDKSIAQQRLIKNNITVATKNSNNTSNVDDEYGGGDIWCKDEDKARGWGWSEGILGRKFTAAKLSHQSIPAGAVILRPPPTPRAATQQDIIDCFVLSVPPWFRIKYGQQYIPCFTCKLIEHDQRNNWTKQQLQQNDNMYSSLLLSSTYLPTHPFRFHHKNNHTLCLSLITDTGNNNNNLTLSFRPCQEPVPAGNQLFAGSSETKIYGFLAPDWYKGIQSQLVDIMKFNNTNNNCEIIKNIEMALLSSSSSSSIIQREPIELFSNSFTKSYTHQDG